MPNSFPHRRPARSGSFKPPKAPPPPTGYLMVFYMSPKTGEYTKTMGAIAPICYAIGENDLDPFWETIKSAPWYDIQPIKTAKKITSGILLGQVLLFMAACVTALEQERIKQVEKFFAYIGCFLLLLCQFWIEGRYSDKIKDRTKYIKLKADDQNRELLHEINLKLVVEKIGDWITLEYVHEFVQAQALPVLEVGQNLPPLPPIIPIEETLLPPMHANPPGYNHYANPDHGGMQGPSDATLTAQPMLLPSNHGGYQPPNIAMAPYYGDTYKTKPGNENYGNQNNNPYGPPQPPVEELGLYQNNLPPQSNQIYLSDDPAPMNNNGWGVNPIKEV